MINEINIFLPWIWETHQVLLGWVVRCYHCNPFFVFGRWIFCLPCNYSHLSNFGKSYYFFLLSNENSWIHECQSKLNQGFEVYLQSSSKLFSKCTLFHIISVSHDFVLICNLVFKFNKYFHFIHWTNTMNEFQICPVSAQECKLHRWNKSQNMTLSVFCRTMS